MAKGKTLEEAVDEQEADPAPRVSPLREYDNLGPDWKGPKGRGRMTDEFKRDLAITKAADDADEEDRQDRAKRRRRKLYDNPRSQKD